MAARLSVNVDHVATVRQARKGQEPDPVAAAALAELAGCHGIIVHLREDRRHIQDRDVEVLRKTVKTHLNLEMAATDEMIGIALRLKPDMCTLVPEKREELTTEGGLDVVRHFDQVRRAVRALQEGMIKVSLFIDTDARQIQAAKDAGKVTIEVLEPGKRARLNFRDYEKAGDNLGVEVNLVNNRPLGIKVATYLDDAKDVVLLEVRMGQLNDGTTYAADITLNATAKELTVTVKNSGYRKTQ
jgi:pyridoxine 5'-phosphate synthase